MRECVQRVHRLSTLDGEGEAVRRGIEGDGERERQTEIQIRGTRGEIVVSLIIDRGVVALLMRGMVNIRNPSWYKHATCLGSFTGPSTVDSQEGRRQAGVAGQISAV
jgi:hypothetical protein